MNVLADTNVALRFTHQNDSRNALVTNAIGELVLSGHHLFVVPQVPYELWAVVTRPASANGLGWSSSTTRSVIEGLRSQWTYLPDPPDLFSTWLDLVTTHRVSGKPAHDARLAAAVKVHQLDALFTLNAGDFGRFDLNVLTPTDL